MSKRKSLSPLSREHQNVATNEMNDVYVKIETNLSHYFNMSEDHDIHVDAKKAYISDEYKYSDPVQLAAESAYTQQATKKSRKQSQSAYDQAQAKDSKKRLLNLELAKTMFEENVEKHIENRKFDNDIHNPLHNIVLK